MTYDEVLSSYGWRETGGGNNFTRYESLLDKNPICIFEFSNEKGPDDSHWAMLFSSDEDKFLAGGFSVESLNRFLKSFGYFAPQKCTRKQPHDGPCNGWPCDYIKSKLS